MKNRFALPSIALAMLPAVASAQDAPPPPKVEEARIPFPSTIRDFRADGDDAIYLRAGRQWYRGTFMAPCRELPWAWSVAFDNRHGIGGVDRYSTLIVRDERCSLTSLVRIPGEPPVKKVKPRAQPKG